MAAAVALLYLEDWGPIQCRWVDAAVIEAISRREAMEEIARMRAAMSDSLLMQEAAVKVKKSKLQPR